MINVVMKIKARKTFFCLMYAINISWSEIVVRSVVSGSVSANHLTETVTKENVSNDAISNGNITNCDKINSTIITTTENLHFPTCVNVTLTSGQYSTTNNSNNNLHTNANSKAIHKHNHSVDDQVDEGGATVCYPLSPQIITCDAVLHNGSTVRTQNHTLYSSECQLALAYLGDYVMEPDGSAISCQEPIHPVPITTPRCNYIGVSRSEFDELVNGAAWSRQEVNRILNKTLQQLVTWNAEGSWANICYPLTAAFLNCKSKYIQDASAFSIEKDHTLYLKRTHATMGRGEYYKAGEWTAVVCLPPDPPNNAAYRIYRVFNGFYILSSVCLSLTLIYLLTVPDATPNNEHSKCLVCHVSALLLMYVGETTRLFAFQYLSATGLCYIVYVVVYVSSMAAFFWLNVLSFDVLVVICRMQTSRLQCGIAGERGRFGFYCVYAWGAPALLCALSLIVDRFKTIQRALLIFPGIQKMCWFNQRSATWLFYYGPLAVITGTNLLFFLLTVFNLQYASQGLGMVNRKHNKRLLTVCCKLSVTMGICWMSEVITYAINENYKHNYWYISNGLTSIQGVAIFLVYVCKRETGYLIYQLWSSTWSKFSGRNLNTNNKTEINRTNSTFSAATNIYIISTEMKASPIGNSSLRHN